LKREVGGVAILSFSGMEIKIKVLVKILFINSPNDAPLALRGPLPWRPFCSLQLSSVARSGVWGLAPIKERK
jgi:hypothetical protein